MSATEGASPVRLCIIVTSSQTLYYLHRGLFSYLRERGFEVVGVSNPGPEHEWLRQQHDVEVHAIPMARQPAPLADLASLVRLYFFLRGHRFDIVHVSTPKASLLGTLAALATGHRCLLATIRGRTYESLRGPKRELLAGVDRFVCRMSKQVVPICRELGQALVDEGICRPDKIWMIGSGSSNGIDTDRFVRSDDTLRRGRELRRELGLSDEDLLILTIGRIRREKGINELVQAFVELQEAHPEAYLLLVGKEEPVDPLEPRTLEIIESHEHIKRLEWLENPIPAYAAADIVAFPSYREGFGNVAIEASAMELPVVAFDVMGVRESVQDGLSGILVPLGDADALGEALRRLADDSELRALLGRQGRARVEAQFRNEVVWEGLVALYRELTS